MTMLSPYFFPGVRRTLLPHAVLNWLRYVFFERGETGKRMGRRVVLLYQVWWLWAVSCPLPL